MGDVLCKVLGEVALQRDSKETKCNNEMKKQFPEQFPKQNTIADKTPLRKWSATS